MYLHVTLATHSEFNENVTLDMSMIIVLCSNGVHCSTQCPMVGPIVYFSVRPMDPKLEDTQRFIRGTTRVY